MTEKPESKTLINNELNNSLDNNKNKKIGGGSQKKIFDDLSFRTIIAGYSNLEEALFSIKKSFERIKFCFQTFFNILSVILAFYIVVFISYAWSSDFIAANIIKVKCYFEKRDDRDIKILESEIKDRKRYSDTKNRKEFKEPEELREEFDKLQSSNNKGLAICEFYNNNKKIKSMNAVQRSVEYNRIVKKREKLINILEQLKEKKIKIEEISSEDKEIIEKTVEVCLSSPTQMLVTIIILGFTYVLDGVVTSWLKTPFGQLCFSINGSPFISYNDKDELIGTLTTSVELPKETLKKFGIMAVGASIVDVILNLRGLWSRESGALLLNLAFLVPIVWTYIKLFSVINRIKYLENSFIDTITKVHAVIQSEKKKPSSKTKKNV